MYTLFQRKEAVKLYILFGYKSAAVISMLSYPDRRTLKKWYKEYVDNGNKHILNYSRAPRFTKKRVSGSRCYQNPKL